MPRWRLSLGVVLLALPGLATSASSQGFHWTISNSTTDPMSNSGAIAPGPTAFSGNLYLWYCSVAVTNAAAAEFDIVELRGAGLPTAFSPTNGFLNAGIPSSLLLAVGGCQPGLLLAGAFSVGPDSYLPDIELCLAPSTGNNRNVTIGCDQLTYTNDWIGFAKTGGACATITTACQASWVHCGVILCNPDGSCTYDAVTCQGDCSCTEGVGVQDCADCALTAVSPQSWGRIKSLYR